MRAEIISIGDELTSGQRLDTNSQWLSQRLGELGVPVVAHATVADDLDTNVEVFRQAIARAEIVVATGGLGPTADDLTREALARVIERPLVLDEGALAHIRGLFARRKRDMPERNVVQAMFPQGSTIIPNPEGTAPGIELSVPRSSGGISTVFALPGVPAEMKQMWNASVVPSLQRLGVVGRVIRHKRVKCFGLGESALEQMLPDLIRRGRDPSVGITVHEGTITLRVTASAPTAAECHASMDDTLATIRECLGILVFGYEDEELEGSVARLLDERGETLATCECGTRGLIAEWLAGHELAAQRVRGSLVVPSFEAAAGALGFDSPAIGGESQPFAEQTGALAENVRRKLGADWGLAVSPFVESATAGEPGVVYLALASSRGTVVKPSPLGYHSAIVRPLAAKQGLNELRLALGR